MAKPQLVSRIPSLAAIGDKAVGPPRTECAEVTHRASVGTTLHEGHHARLVGPHRHRMVGAVDSAGADLDVSWRAASLRQRTPAFGRKPVTET